MTSARIDAVKLIVNIDGACKGNPGPASFGVIVRNSDENVICELSGNIGVATNNIAEYTALVRALDFALESGASELEVRSDSELLVEQMNGRYKVKSPNLIAIWQRAVSLSKQIKSINIIHVPRSKNSEADSLANRALVKPLNFL